MPEAYSGARLVTPFGSSLNGMTYRGCVPDSVLCYTFHKRHDGKIKPVISSREQVGGLDEGWGEDGELASWVDIADIGASSTWMGQTRTYIQLAGHFRATSKVRGLGFVRGLRLHCSSCPEYWLEVDWHHWWLPWAKHFTSPTRPHYGLTALGSVPPRTDKKQQARRLATILIGCSRACLDMTGETKGALRRHVPAEISLEASLLTPNLALLPHAHELLNHLLTSSSSASPSTPHSRKAESLLFGVTALGRR